MRLTVETEKPVELDFWGKVAAISDSNRGDYTVEIERTAPEFDESNVFIKGYCAEIPLPEFSKTRMFQIVGGGAFICIVRHIHKGTIKIRHSVSFAGEPKPAYLSSGSAAKGNGPGEPAPQIKQPQYTYEELWEKVNRDFDEKRRRENDADERRLMRETIGRLEKAMLRGNGNGNGHHNATLEAIETLVKAKELIGGGGSDGLGLEAVLKLMDKSESKGEQRVKDLADLASKYAQDPDSATENSMIEALVELLKGGRQKQDLEDLTKGKPGMAGAFEIFRKFKEDLANIVAEYHALAATAIRGSQTPDELLTAIREMLAYAKQQQDEYEDEEEEEKGAGEDRSGNRESEAPDKPGTRKPKKPDKKSDNKNHS